jgi:hypothetical protein
MKQSGWPQHYGANRKTRARSYQQSAQTGHDAIRASKVGGPLASPIQNQNLVSQQDRFGNNRTDSTGTTKPDDDDDRMQKKGENVAHSQDGIRVKKLKNSRRLRNSPARKKCGQTRRHPTTIRSSPAHPRPIEHNRPYATSQTRVKVAGQGFPTSDMCLERLILGSMREPMHSPWACPTGP